MKVRLPLSLCAVLILACAVSAAAQDRIGEAVNLEGAVSLTRDGDLLDASRVQIGIQIENFDVLSTGEDGQAEVRLSGTRAPAATITISPDTQFSFELSSVNSRLKSAVGLVSGSLAMKVAKLSSAQSLEVHTGSAVLGVRGTEFSVALSPSEEVLVTCGSGEVICTDEDGTEAMAIPGTVVERREGARLAPLPVAAADLEIFRKKWLADRMAAAKANALPLIRRNAVLYEKLRGEFERDHQRLAQKRSILSKWHEESRRGRLGTRLEVEKEKREIGLILIGLRRTLFRLERVAFRLSRLKALHDQGYGKGLIREGLSTDTFFEQFEKENADLRRKMAAARYAAKLYALRNNGADPTSPDEMWRLQRGTR